MSFRLVPLLPVLLGVASAEVALGLSTPLIALLMVRLGASSDVIGLVASAYYVGFLAGSLTADRLIRRIGHVRTFAVLAAVAADAALVCVFAEAPWMVAISRLLVGYATSGMLMVAESWLNDRADSATRGATFSAYLVVSWGPAALGPLLLSVVPPSPLLFVTVGFAFAAAVVPMALTTQLNPVVAARKRMGPIALFRISPVGAACAVASGLVNSAYYAMAPIYLGTIGQNASAIGAFTSVAMIAGLAVQVPIGIASDRLGRRPVALTAMAVGFAAAIALLAIGPASLWTLAAVGFVYSAATAPLYGLGASQTNDRMQRGDYVAASGGLLFAWSLGSSLSPTLAGAVMGAVGPSGLFYYLIAILGGVALFTVLRMLQRAEVPRDARGVYVPAAAAPARYAELSAGTDAKPTDAKPGDAKPTDAKPAEAAAEAAR
jgi:MFS family permease